MDNFDAHKWFKKEYLGEGHTEDKTNKDQFIRSYDQLSDDDKLKLAKIQAMMTKERSLKEDDLNEASQYTREIGLKIIELIRSTGVDPSDMMDAIGEEYGISFEFGRG